MGSASGGKRILVVNDTEEVLELFKDIIEGMGHSIVPLTYAPDDLEQIVAIQPDLAIVDFLMGGMEFRGWQLVQKLRMHRGTASIPVIICTGARREVHEYEGWLTEKGVTVVFKPFDVEDLERAIERAFRGRELRQEQEAAKAEAAKADPAGPSSD